MTFADALSYVRARLGVSSGESATVDALIELQLDLEYQRLVLEYELEVESASLITTADDPVVDLPDDVTSLLKIYRDDVVLEPVDPDTFARLVAGSSTSGATEPEAYMRSGSRRIRVWPTPGENGTDLTAWYAASATTWGDGVGDDDEPLSLPSAFHDLPCERVVAFLALIEEATDLAMAASARAEQLEARLARHLGRRLGLGSATISIKGHA